MSTKVRTHNGRIVLSDAQWHESGANVPAVRNNQQVTSNTTPTQPQAVPTGIELSEWDYQQIVIKVSGIMNGPLQCLRLLSQYKRVFLVEFVPHLTIDPVLPVTFVPLGQEHDRAYRYFAEWIMAWHPTDMHMSHNRWYSNCKRYAETCVNAAYDGLKHDEADYYAREMLFTLANPDRRNLNVTAASLPRQTGWRYAYEM